MTDVWSERAEAFRQSPAHCQGPDLDLVVAWCEPGEGVQALDVATGGGHVARRLREAGCDVVSVDSRDRVVVEDNLFTSDAFEEAERLHDPTHVRCYSEQEWRTFFAEAGLEVEETDVFERRLDVDAWLARTATPEEDAVRVRELLADRIDDGRMVFRSLVLRGRKT